MVIIIKNNNVISLFDYEQLILLYLMTFQQLKLAIFYIVMVGLSILENLGQMNASLPKFIHENLEVLKQKGEHTDS